MFLLQLLGGVCKDALCSDQCYTDTTIFFSPLKERSDHKCFNSDFECYGHRACYKEAGVCINPCDTHTFVDDHYEDIDTYNPAGYSAPKCELDKESGNTYCSVTN